MKKLDTRAMYLRNFVFGVEDSIVSTVGLLSGVAAADVPGSTVFLTGLVLISVEAFSMGAGSFLAESEAEDIMEQKEVSSRKPFFGSLIMFISYFVSGLIPLLPYQFLEGGRAFRTSIIVSILALVCLGFIGAKVAKIKTGKNIVRMVIIGGLAIVIGILVGSITN
jgi:VIT1/CCC1 family predicted Fe2+/Mn2+ transporter